MPYHVDLLQIRPANLSQIERLAGLLQQPHLTEAERRLVLSLRPLRAYAQAVGAQLRIQLLTV